MAWMSLMGRDSVEYHERTVMDRGDDPVSNALEYYASRGETPMQWGGAGAGPLGLSGEVGRNQWRAIFGVGGAHHPESGERMVHCMRPGMELVVSSHKSIAELGVIGRAEDMHQILDAETRATMEYLDNLVQAQGGRRGRAQVRAPTDGLTWAVTRHATTRSGDPQPHDHVLVANVLRLRDEQGGWKALDTGFVRDHLHAATAVGRMAAAAKAVELGYAIEPDPGRSGRLGAFAVTGIPKEAWEIHATRSAQIDEAVGPDASYRSRAVAARATRERKNYQGTEELVPRWRDELARAGYPAYKLVAAVERAGVAYQPPSPDILDRLPAELLSPGGRLASEKTFTRDDVIIAVAPYLHGLPVSLLDSAVDKVLSHEAAIALPLVSRAREPVFAAACVIEDEKHIAALAEVLAERPGPRLSDEAAASAVRHVELSNGFRLTERQAEVAQGLMTSGHSLDLVLGVAGSGKTSTLAAVRAGFEAAGYTVLGTATSGQAAKALGQGAGVSSSTVASLTWRLEHGQEALSPRHVLVLDEAAMTSDADVGRLLGAVAASGAKLVAVGDYCQIDSVGPGGALEALAKCHPGHTWTLRDNLRQRDPSERHALDHLRAGSVPGAVAWYAKNGRVHPARGPQQAMLAMVRAWATDAVAGREVLMVAYHRDAVEALNRAARVVWGELGRLSGPELEAPGGRRFRAGDPVVALAPGPGHQWVTSQRAVVKSVDLEHGSLVAVTPEGAVLHMGPEHIGADQLAHGFAVTAHRSQGATVDVTHALEDGGGRELAYVAMSRARGETHVHVVARGLREAAERLSWAWAHERRQPWALGRNPQAVLAELYTERQRLAASVPPDRSHLVAQARHQYEAAAQDARDLNDGTGRWAHTEAGRAAGALREAAMGHQEAVQDLERPGLGTWARHKARRALSDTATALNYAKEAWAQAVEPYADQLEARRVQLGRQLDEHEQAQRKREAFLAEHPEVPARLAELGQSIKVAEQQGRQRFLEQLRQREQDRHFGISHEVDNGRGIVM